MSGVRLLTDDEMKRVFERVRNEVASECDPMAISPELARRRYKWTYEHVKLAKRLGLPSVARSIHDKHGPWVVLTESYLDPYR